jgi:large conductance mechanosensitive channel
VRYSFHNNPVAARKAWIEEETMVKEFKEFIMRGSVVDLAIGVIIGAAFTAIVNSLVKDIFMPIIGYVLGGVDFTNMFIVLGGGSYATLADAQKAGAATINYGIFINAVITFLLVAVILFFIIKAINKLQKQPVPAPANTKECPYCLSTIPLAATRCPNCTSQL